MGDGDGTKELIFSGTGTYFGNLNEHVSNCSSYFLPTNCRLLPEIVKYPTQVPSTCWCWSQFYGESGGPVGCSCGPTFRGEGGWCTIAQRCRLRSSQAPIKHHVYVISLGDLGCCWSPKWRTTCGKKRCSKYCLTDRGLQDVFCRDSPKVSEISSLVYLQLGLSGNLKNGWHGHGVLVDSPWEVKKSKVPECARHTQKGDTFSMI